MEVVLFPKSHAYEAIEPEETVEPSVKLKLFPVRHCWSSAILKAVAGCGSGHTSRHGCNWWWEAGTGDQ